MLSNRLSGLLKSLGEIKVPVFCLIMRLTKQPNSRKTPPLARRCRAIGDNGSTL